MSDISLRRETLQILFDTAVGSMDFGSGFLDDEEVMNLREVATLLGVDPMDATPSNYRCKYGAEHEWTSAPSRLYCWRCNKTKEALDAMVHATKPLESER